MRYGHSLELSLSISVFISVVSIGFLMEQRVSLASFCADKTWWKAAILNIDGYSVAFLLNTISCFPLWFFDKQMSFWRT